MEETDNIWDMRMLWQRRLDTLINCITEAAINRDVGEYYRLLKRLRMNVFFRMDKSFNNKKMKGDLAEVGKIIYDNVFMGKDDKNSNRKRKEAYNKAYEKLEELEEILYEAIDSAGLFMKRYKKQKGLSKVRSLLEPPDEDEED